MTLHHAPQSIRELAETAAAAAAVRVVEIEDSLALRRACTLLERVWGRNADGVPISVELLRSIVHADGAITAAFPNAPDADEPVGIAVLVLANHTDTYSLIAAAAPGQANRGLGYALKQRQRWWAMDRGRTTMRWTFDPLMARNARFNLAKLGVEITDYVPSFYGPMDDNINAGDEGDRLVARWQLATAGMPLRSSETGRPGRLPKRAESPDPHLLATQVSKVGPDGAPAYVIGDDEEWCRVPADVLALRRADPGQAREWRSSTRAVLTDALARGLTVRSFTRSGWYHLVQGEPR